MTERAKKPVVIIGAGPYGLATAAHLSARGVPLRIFGRPMESWRERMPAGMFLKSTPSASSISDPKGNGSLAAFRTGHGRTPGGDLDPIGIEEFVAYGQWFQQTFVPELETERVTRIIRHDGGFSVALDTGELVSSRAVVMASGLQPFTRIPPHLEPLVEQGLGSHSSAHADLSCFTGRRVAVIGAGQSAMESAALLHESGARPILVARTSFLRFAVPPLTDSGKDRPLALRTAKPGTPLGPGWSFVAYSRAPAAFRYLPDQARAHLVRTVLGPSGAWWLRNRVEGRFPVLLGSPVREFEAAQGVVRVRLDGRPGALEVDHVLAATGYQVDVGRIPELDAALRQAIRCSPSGAPRLDLGFQSSVPGLYFTGLSAADTFGPLMRFVAGTGFAARKISNALADKGRF